MGKGIFLNLYPVRVQLGTEADTYTVVYITFKRVTCSAAECHACEFGEDRDLRAKENKDAQRLTREGCARRSVTRVSITEENFLIRLSESLLACLNTRSSRGNRDDDEKRSRRVVH